MNALETLPEDNITIDDVVETLALIEDLENRVKSIEEGNTVTHEEAKSILRNRLGNLWQG